MLTQQWDLKVAEDVDVSGMVWGSEFREFHKETTDTKKEDLWETESVRGTNKSKLSQI